ncbi:MAG: GNAT family N-acetyltransferase [Marivibrio sp.]|uniref:GNAT family N-acetyltransferase n=1 Tax=Marivibrio sp. TaxID=2039719 RepID=UPI0032F07A56
MSRENAPPAAQTPPADATVPAGDPTLRAAGRLRVEGREVAYDVRALGPDSLEALDAVQQEAARLIGDADWDLFHPHPPEEIQLFMDGEGAVFGLFVDGRLEGYCFLGLPGGRLESFADLLPEGSGAVPAEERSAVAHIDGVYAPPYLRGRGLQRVMIRVRMDHALARGCRHFLANASPRNTPSCRNMTRAGMAVRQIAYMHPTPRGAKLRVLLHKDVGRPVTFDPNVAPVAVPAMDEARQQDLLAHGYLGCDFKRDADGDPLVLYARALAGRPENAA